VGEIEIAADRLDLVGKRVLKILLGLGSLERRHVLSSSLVGKADDEYDRAPPGVGSQWLRRFLICGWSRVPVDADDHVDPTDDGARGRFRQAGYGDMFARNVEQAAAILEKEVIMVTDVGVRIGASGIHHHLNAATLPR
jgi:hypothetical protein